MPAAFKRTEKKIHAVLPKHPDEREGKRLRGPAAVPRRADVVP